MADLSAPPARPAAFTRVLARKARTLCLEKLGLLQFTLGSDAPETKSLRQSIDRAFVCLKVPDLWARTAPFDRVSFLRAQKALRRLDEREPVGIVLAVGQLLQLVEKQIRALAGEFLVINDRLDDVAMNRQVLDALLSVQRQIIGRMQFFGAPLMQDGEFAGLQDRQQSVVRSYSQRLERGAGNATLADRDAIAAQGRSIEQAGAIPDFKRRYASFTALIEQKLHSFA